MVGAAKFNLISTSTTTTISTNCCPYSIRVIVNKPFHYGLITQSDHSRLFTKRCDGRAVGGTGKCCSSRSRAPDAYWGCACGGGDLCLLRVYHTRACDYSM